jgi:DNA adenine methylase
VCDFSASIAKAVSDDFVYLDPPYAPETETSFVGYTENGFNTDNHIALFNSVHKLSAQGTKIMMSNADVKLVRDNFTTENYKTATVLCKRSINSKKPESKTTEVIIKNY